MYIYLKGKYNLCKQLINELWLPDKTMGIYHCMPVSLRNLSEKCILCLWLVYHHQHLSLKQFSRPIWQYVTKFFGSELKDTFMATAHRKLSLTFSVDL